MAEQGDSRPSPIRWDPVQNTYIELKSMQHGRELDELNQQLQNQINEHDEYEIYLNNQINEYDNDVSMIQALLIQDPRNNKYIEVNNLRDSVKIDKLNEIVENYEKEENKYYEYYKNLLREYDLNYLKNLIEKYKQYIYLYNIFV